jgi:transcriptional regulator with XRE-family HTH domain
MSIFSKNLRFLRKKGNHNQEEISRLFNKRANTIGNWENEKSEPNLAELVRLGAYFKVSIQDLLHTDMELRPEPQDPVFRDPAYTTEKSTTYLQQEPVSSLASEGSPDAFWIVLRELRTLNNKVDLLVSGMENTSFKKNSDKSYH